MKKNSMLLMLSISLTFCSLAQTNQPTPLVRSVNSTIMQQVLNDFDRRIPLVIFVPGFFFIGSAQIQENTFFNEYDFYEEDASPNSSEFYQKIVFEAAKPALIPYIPKDSIMNVRVMDENNLIFEFNFKHENDTLLFNLTDGTQNKTKSIGYLGDKVITTSYNDKRKMTMYSSRLYGDTLRRSELWENPVRSISEINYSNGHLKGISYYKESINEVKLLSSERFLYNELNQPSSREYLDKKGKVKKIINYYYNGDTLTQYTIRKGSEIILSIVNVYDKTDNSTLRTYLGKNSKYAKVLYFNSERGVLNIEIEENESVRKTGYILRTDVNNRLSELESVSIVSDQLLKATRLRWVFNYNEKGNLSSIKVIGNNGYIAKTINLEYSYMSPEL